MTVIDEIAAERKRQREDEDWSDSHDDEHDDGSLVAAAACYAYQSSIDKGITRGLADEKAGHLSIINFMWPSSWDWEWWKPKGKRRNLIRAAALIVAEVERMDRADAKKPKSRRAPVPLTRSR
jgi:hypothetical protein